VAKKQKKTKGCSFLGKKQYIPLNFDFQHAYYENKNKIVQQVEFQSQCQCVSQYLPKVLAQLYSKHMDARSQVLLLSANQDY
jgi:hypothetical protein